MDTLQCAVVLAKLEQFDWEVAKRLEIGALYNATLDRLGITTVRQRADRSSVFAQYTVLLDNREAMQGKLKDAGIPTAVHYPIPLTLQPAYAHLCCPDCTPNAAQAARKVMSLPMHAYLTVQDVEHIASKLAGAVD